MRGLQFSTWGKNANAIASVPTLVPQRLGTASLVALALCLTFVPSAWAIGGVDKPARRLL